MQCKTRKGNPQAFRVKDPNSILFIIVTIDKNTKYLYDNEDIIVNKLELIIISRVLHAGIEFLYGIQIHKEYSAM